MQRRFHLLARKRLRIGFDAQAALFQHDIALGEHVRLGEIEIDHAVGLELHHQRQTVLGDALEVGGVVMAW